MSENETNKPLDWKKVHELVIDQANEVVEGFGIGDVNWFLRDSNVSLLEQPLQPQPATPEKRYVSDFASPSMPALVTPSSPHLQVLNTNDNSVSKTRPSIAPIQEEEAQSMLTISTNNLTSRDQKRRSSVSSNASTGSTASNSTLNGGKFFTKLKNRLLRSDSNSNTSTANSPIFRNEYDIEKSTHDMPIPINSSLQQLFVDSAGPRSPLSVKSGKELEESYDDPRLIEYVQYFSQQDSKPTFKANPLNIPKRIELQNRMISSSPKSPKVESSKFTSLFRRRSVSTSVPSSPVRPPAESPTPSSQASDPNTEENSIGNGLIDFKKMRPLKHVAFHSLTFLIDPPQQIPSRNPRKGNVEILPLGAIRINPLSEVDKAQIEKSLRGQGGGLVVGGTGAFSLTKKDAEALEDKSEASTTLESSTNSKREVDTGIKLYAKPLGIDKPVAQSVSRLGYTAPVKKMALDLMYSRCCHLREILPIPGIAKQIPKDSMAPLPFLQFRNPTPTMIEIETFADFIRIAPILCISLDGIHLSYEQWKILLGAMCAKTQLEKLSLRNTPLDSEGWALFCWFLSRNRFISKLDITQCPPLSVVKKKKKIKPEEEAITRMVCNKENRSDMDWLMFTACLIARQGIEELILTGCCVTDLQVFETLVRKAISIRTAKLGLAYNQLSPQQFSVVIEHFFLSNKAKGLDLGYNDLLSSAFLKAITEMFSKADVLRDKITGSKLGFMSLNATNLRFNNLFRDVYEKVLAKLPNLKFLDLSNNPKLFGNFNSNIDSGDASSGLSHDQSLDESNTNMRSESITSYFCSILPTFKTLVRLHLENNGLSSQSLLNLFEIVPFCKNLVYLSILGNPVDIYSATSLIQALKNSTSLMTVDADYLNLPESFKEKIGSLSMRNLENYYNKLMNKKPGVETANAVIDNLQVETLTDQLNKILSQRNDGKLDLNLPEVKLFIDRTQRYRQKLKVSIDDLFALQYSSELSIEGKEALIRLLFVDSSLERGLKLIDDSLVGHDESITSTDILNMNLAEDEKSSMKNFAHRKDAIDASDQNEGFSEVDSSALPISRNQSSATLSSLNKEEGSVMKLSRLADNDPVLDKFEDCSGEQMRRKMLDFDISDLDNLFDLINSARKRGMCFKEVFSDTSFMNNFKDDFKQQIENLKRYAASNNRRNSSERLDSLQVELSQSSESSHIDEDKSRTDMNEAYDRILSKFNK